MNRIQKILYMVEKENINSKNILGLTFTNKAAKEMKQKMISSLPKDNLMVQKLSYLTFATFHSFCFKMLRDFQVVPKTVICYNEYEQRNVFKKLLTEIRRVAKESKVKSDKEKGVSIEIDDKQYIDAQLKEKDISKETNNHVKEIITLITRF